ncbi:MAG: creatininase family protein [Anaerolineales bacterium]|nr:creatininase family protein [Anaerolineales bacterium]MDW8277694.1 creatininase family protein [Anaerolineales bacterium]
MTHFFRFDDLTWPEVAELPRDVPLVLPLGEGYAQSALAEALSQPPRIGLLPPFPFGWRGSGLEVPEPVLGLYIGNLLASLREDGFSRVYALTPLDIDLGLACAQLCLPCALPPACSPLPPNSERGKVILLPIGHTEQHAYHLPLSVDTIIIEAIAKGAAEAAPDSGYTLPVMPYGVSTHRDSFPGTLNAGGRAFEDFWLAVVDALVERGFDKFYLMSGHGGNMSFLVNVVKYAGDRHKRIFCATAFLHTAGPAGAAALEQYRESPIGGMGHACELETSMVLALRPDLVHMERAADDTDFIATPSYYMDWIEGGALIANPPWDDDTVSGAYGAGSLGTAEKGRRWLEVAIAEKVQHIHEIHEQHQRREARRRAGFGNWGKRNLKNLENTV